jgi:hypothetical protein
MIKMPYRKIVSALLGFVLLSLSGVAQAEVFLVTPDSLTASLEKAAPGSELHLAPGDYGSLRLSGDYSKGGKPITLRSQDPAHPARVSRFAIRGANGLVLSDIVFDYRFTKGDDINREKPFQIMESTDITIRNALFDGDLAQSDKVALNGFGAGFGLVVRKAKGVVLENNELRRWSRAMVISESSNIVLRGNNIHALRSDGLDFAAVQHVQIEGNFFHDFARSPTSTDHPDMIQFWTNGTKTPSVDVRIRNNIFNSGAGLWTQSIFMRNEEVDTGRQGDAMYYRDFEISGNVIINAHLHGITMGEVDGVSIHNNTLIRNMHAKGLIGKNAGLWTPTIRINKAARNVSIQDNIVAKIIGVEKQPGWTVQNNLLIQPDKRGSGGHYNAVFAAALSGDPAKLSSFTYLPEGPAGSGTLGSAFLRPGAPAPGPFKTWPPIANK